MKFTWRNVWLIVERKQKESSLYSFLFHTQVYAAQILASSQGALIHKVWHNSSYAFKKLSLYPVLCQSLPGAENRAVQLEDLMTWEAALSPTPVSPAHSLCHCFCVPALHGRRSVTSLALQWQPRQVPPSLFTNKTKFLLQLYFSDTEKSRSYNRRSCSCFYVAFLT